MGRTREEILEENKLKNTPTPAPTATPVELPVTDLPTEDLPVENFDIPVAEVEFDEDEDDE